MSATATGNVSTATITPTTSCKWLFKRSPDGTTWPADADAIEIASFPNSTAQVQPLQIEFRDGLLLVTGTTLSYTSNNLGAVGSWSVS